MFVFVLFARAVSAETNLFISVIFFYFTQNNPCTGRRIANIQYMTTSARHTHSFSQYPSSHKEHLNEIYQLDLH